MTTSSSGVDTRLYRDVCGRFATGVTVVTTLDEHGPRGLTANAVASLSLDPTLFLVCVDLRAGSHEALERTGRFAINVLAADQEHVSRFFASPTDEHDPMGQHLYRVSDGGSPLLDNALAWLDCRTHEILEGGDHKIFVGEVTSCEIARPEADPLLFFRGEYRDIGADRRT
jgi:3-hydroxy-9,10-secoandrosta-1,3,5(10)-triene-9,17-dione monooxygenase reductase component